MPPCPFHTQLKSSTSSTPRGYTVLIFFTFFMLISNGDNQASAFDFFYLVLEWPGSYCDGTTCCYPKTGKPPTDFSIHGLWPNNNDGSYPQNCDPSNRFDPSQIQGLRGELNQLWSSLSCPSSNSEKFWAHEWEKHGTCSEDSLGDQEDYFRRSLELRKSIDLLGALRSAGISPNGEAYSLARIRAALSRATGGFTPGITCNVDSEDRMRQLYEVYVCVSKDASRLIPCPVLPRSTCPDLVEFPTF